ncbi:NADPH-dependent FMN reductase [Clostridium carboxidivorans P7]|uniref:NADPH-dependent FMN reductase n=1 Tax=Clostridium carboxidivorans P7 TaxID=536227 RepID=C6PU95_9CLOT|nr:flavodoxin family protein [Clostridium carboxidivorans]AKN31362.1 NADPH-dependent FMN reductase [Clostridium carboxidivorans P7]EET87193.1 NADPH-dependent FMN reductase [Clostridium carboxidivorans P7]EFG87246.1 flavin reductase [Clostridium carboxidivorans P7]
MKKILVLTGSGRRHGNSEKLADAFIKGATLHNKITKITLANKKIAPCCNCNYCQDHNGECAIHDDMSEIITALQNNDILVLCSPVYYLGFSAQLKTVIDRTYAESAIGRKIKNTILLSVAGKEDVFVSNCMINAYQQLCDYLGFENLGIISAKGFENPNDIENSKILIDAFELGKSII